MITRFLSNALRVLVLILAHEICWQMSTSCGLFLFGIMLFRRTSSKSRRISYPTRIHFAPSIAASKERVLRWSAARNRTLSFAAWQRNSVHVRVCFTRKCPSHHHRPSATRPRETGVLRSRQQKLQRKVHKIQASTRTIRKQIAILARIMMSRRHQRLSHAIEIPDAPRTRIRERVDEA